MTKLRREARRVIVRGRVQGVAFRYTTRERARELGLAGWVRNLRNGGVEVHVEGEFDAVQELLVWLRAGPPAASVTAAEATGCDPTGCHSFEIAR